MITAAEITGYLWRFSETLPDDGDGYYHGARVALQTAAKHVHRMLENDYHCDCEDDSCPVWRRCEQAMRDRGARV